MDALDVSCFGYPEPANGEADDNLSMDLQAIYRVLDEDSNPSESSAEDSLLKDVSPGESGSHDNSQPHSARGSVGLLGSAGTSMLDYEHGNQEPLSQSCSSPHTLHGSHSDLYSVDDNDGICYTERTEISGYPISTHSAEPSFTEFHLNSTSDCGYNSCKNLLKGESESQLKHVQEDVEYASHYSITGGIEMNSGHYVCTDEDTRGEVSGQQNDSFTFMDSDRSSHIATSSDSTIYQGSNVDNDFSNYFSALPNSPFFVGSSLGYPDHGLFLHLKYNEELMTNTKEEKQFLADTAHVSSNMHSSTIGGTNFQDSKFMSSDSENSSFFGGNVFTEDKELVQLSACDLYMLSEDQATSVKHERGGRIRSYQNFTHGDNFEVSMVQDLNQIPGFLPSIGCHYDLLQHEDKNTNIPFDRVYHHQDIFEGASSTFPGNVGGSDINASEKSLPHALAPVACEKQFGFVEIEGDGKSIQHSSINSNFSKVSTEYSHRDFLKISNVEDDSDVCIIEDISHPAPRIRSGDLGNSLSVTHSSTYADSQQYMSGGMRLKARDESDILRVALQDLSQPKSEVSPPDGLLAVPLLRHQRIALSWMVQKERSSSYCSGGILADDQGLGKTVSTIALMLMERPPVLGENPQKCELETLSLDEDDDVLPANDGVKNETSSCLDIPSRCPMKRMNLVVQPKGRPSAGTLIVCPTSVLRQWAEELHNKVTSKANFSALVYHGSNRTKDPCELAKYDVVLTTYSIVSMEVPKQPLVNKDDEEKGSSEDQGASSVGLPSSRKRKNPPSKNSKKGSDGKLLEAVAGPLAKVAWFRVVLDEAQSIKNHRTQVARACWGLRAKRRWCLSGTPIQNAIDDLYSYFRFLRYEPYAVYTSFCSTIKIPINRNPTKGYRKLQAVLKTIMLRRTKGTLLDGEPIINLPPKYVELKKVDFSKEERDFYSRLEADSRAQFQEYADAGTVKQNYVNILLMLLRLRQACDHPLLVRRYNSNTLWRSSEEMAKKLPREKQMDLLKCLEASLALCGICNDPPEDAVVSVCGHVFCNQCICEHLTGEDNQCPATKCRVRLSMSSVFTKGSLNCSLSDQANCNNSTGCSGSEIEGYEPCSQNLQYDSSKIKAALEVLHSLCNPQGCTSTNTSPQGTFEECSGCPGNSSDACQDHQNQNLSGDKGCNESVVVVREKAIVFSQWTRMLDLLEDCLKNSSIQYRRLDGTMSVIARDKAVKDFNTLPEVTVMIMSLKAASLGLNMVAACHVLLLDLWWNPTTEDQAIDRAHRIGQTRPVTVLRLTVRDTVEDRILALQQKKRKMVASAFGEDGTGGRQSRLTVDDLKYLFMM